MKGTLNRLMSGHVPGQHSRHIWVPPRNWEVWGDNFFLKISPFLGASLKRWFSKLRRSWELCFGGVSRELGGNGNNLWNLTWISSFWSSGGVDNTLCSSIVKHSSFREPLQKIRQCHALKRAWAETFISEEVLDANTTPVAAPHRQSRRARRNNYD